MVKGKRSARSLPTGLAIGVGVSVTVTLMLSAIVAKLVDGGQASEGMIGYFALGINFLAVFAGSVVAATKTGAQRFAVCGALAGIYLAIGLALTALAFDAEYHGIIKTAAVIVASGTVAALLGKKKGRGRQKKHFRK